MMPSSTRRVDRTGIVGKSGRTIRATGGSTIMAFEYEEVDVDENPIMSINLLSLLTGIPVRTIQKERDRMQSAKEFVADPTWFKPLSK
jgi:hypothetical protein